MSPEIDWKSFGDRTIVVVTTYVCSGANREASVVRIFRAILPYRLLTKGRRLKSSTSKKDIGVASISGPTPN